jgi:hypothetical protein
MFLSRHGSEGDPCGARRDNENPAGAKRLGLAITGVRARSALKKRRSRSRWGSTGAASSGVAGCPKRDLRAPRTAIKSRRSRRPQLSYDALSPSKAPHDLLPRQNHLGDMREMVVRDVLIYCRAPPLFALHRSQCRRLAADASYKRAYRFVQNRSRASVAALTGDVAAERPQDQFLRGFLARSIFDFGNKRRSYKKVE